MKSSPASASSSRLPSGVDSTGLPDIVSSARTWPSPGVSISSAIVATGSSPPLSGRSRTRLRQRPWEPRPTRPWPTMSIAGEVNIGPPGASRWPVRMLSAWIAHEQTRPKGWVVRPIRPYAAPAFALARSLASLTIVASSMPLTDAAHSAVKGSTAARTWSTPSTYAAGLVSPSAKSVLTIASSTAASVPGRTKWCSSATLAVSVRRGSMTTRRPPRFCRARRRWGKSGTVQRLPLDAIGLPPKTSTSSERSMSGTGSRSWWP